MFKTKSPPATTEPAMPANPRKPSGVPTIISADMTVTGNLKSTGDVQVEGIVMGDVSATKITIAEGGTIIGNITAQHTRICGTVNGTTHSNNVSLAASARVTGDIHHDILAIEAGALLEGHSSRIIPANPPALNAPTPEAAMAEG